jgi:hypothetical protein
MNQPFSNSQFRAREALLHPNASAPALREAGVVKALILAEGRACPPRCSSAAP